MSAASSGVASTLPQAAARGERFADEAFAQTKFRLYEAHESAPLAGYPVFFISSSSIIFRIAALFALLCSSMRYFRFSVIYAFSGVFPRLLLFFSLSIGFLYVSQSFRIF